MQKRRIAIDSLDADSLDFDPTLPLEQARTPPAWWYFSPQLATLEADRIFARCWQPAARIDQVSEPGDFVTATVAGEPIVVVRGEDGAVRCFSNVCRHRAAIVATQEVGRCRRFRCRYHGWTYDLEGRLRGMPEFEPAAGFDVEGDGLPQFACQTWGFYVWVNLAPSPPPLVQYLAPMPERTEALLAEPLVWGARRVYDLECNWKVFVDNFQDGGYHVNTVHPSLAGAIDYRSYRTEMYDHTAVQISPLREASDERIRDLRSGDSAYYWWMFPNFMLNLYSGVADAHWVEPLGPERCRIVMDWFFPPDRLPEKDAWARESLAVSHEIQVEDVAICEEVQRGLRSRTFDKGWYSVKREAPVYHFHRLLYRYLRE